MLAPVQLANVEAMRACIPVIGKPRHRPQVKIPIQRVRHRLARAETRRPKNGAAIAIGVDGLQFADAAAADKFARQAELAAVLAALLRARLVSASVTLDRREHLLAFRDGDG